MGRRTDRTFADAASHVDARGPGRPKVMLQIFEETYPHIWEKLDRKRIRGTWPAWCFMPPSKLHPIIMGYARKWEVLAARMPSILSPRQVQMVVHSGTVSDTMSCMALGFWRLSKGVYVVDPTVASAVAASTFNRIPFEVLQRMPEHCVYVAAEWDSQNEVLGRVLGFFAQLTLVGDEPRLVLVLDTEHGPKSVSVMRGPDGSICDDDKVEQSRLEETFEREWARLSGAPDSAGLLTDLEAASAASARRALALVLLLCSEEPDIDATPRGAAAPARTRRGVRGLPPSEVRVWQVGVRLGAALRKAWEVADAEAGSERPHGRPRPHLRKAHFHHFWRGPKAVPEQRHLVMRWVHEALVNAKSADELAVTVRPVEED